MFEFKPLHRDAIDESLAKAQHYRLLNEPRDAASVCRDILDLRPDHQEAIVTLVLALTDQFGKVPRITLRHANELVPRLEDPYQRVYCAGIICERWAKAQLAQGYPGFVAFDWLSKAMQHYDEAEKLSPAGNDEAVLRWNACVRIMRNRKDIRPRRDEQDESLLRDV